MTTTAGTAADVVTDAVTGVDEAEHGAQRDDAPAAGRRARSSRGRPQDDDRTEAILAAAGDALLELGYDRLRIQDVAERASAGTGAIYRRWSTKESLIAEAIRVLPDPDAPITNDPVADLRALIVLKHEAAVAQPDLLPGMLSAMRAHPEIAEAVHERFSESMFRDAVARVVGDDHPRLDVLAEMPSALVLHRMAFGAEDVDLHGLATDVVELILAAGAA